MAEYNARKVVSDILTNRYFTNHGPLARALEQTLEEHMGARHAVLVGSLELGLLVALIALRTRQHSRLVYYPGDEDPCLVHVGAFSGLSIHALDTTDSVVQDTDVLYRTLREERDLNCASVGQGQQQLVVHYPDWSSARPEQGISDGFPEPVLLELPTRHGGAVLLFNSDELAERARNVRSSYGVRKQVPVFVTCNGRYSEAQAGTVLDYLANSLGWS